MYFAYFDESGDSGYSNSPTDTFALSALLVHDKEWLSALDQVVAFRRYLRDQFHIQSRLELKASWIIHNKGDVRKAGLSYDARLAAYRAAMRFQRKAGVFRAFTILIVKSRIAKRSINVRDTAWTYAIQRLERFGTGAGDTVHMIPDEGHGDFIRKKVRAMRRFHRAPSAFGNGSLDRKAQNIVEDPSDRRSSESFFIQLADLNAYASFRRVFPAPTFGGDIWDELGGSRVAEVNKLSGGPPGIVVWPEDEKASHP